MSKDIVDPEKSKACYSVPLLLGLSGFYVGFYATAGWLFKALRHADEDAKIWLPRLDTSWLPWVG